MKATRTGSGRLCRKAEAGEGGVEIPGAHACLSNVDSASPWGALRLIPALSLTGDGRSPCAVTLFHSFLWVLGEVSGCP